MDEQMERIKAVFNNSEIPEVSVATLQYYLDYLKTHLTCPCMLTGIESIGYFKWEERYSFGYGSKSEYKRLRRENGSFQDHYELRTLDTATVDKDWFDILVKVERIPYHKRFEIPLSELQALDEDSKNYQLLNDFSVWRVNWPPAWY